MADQEDKKDVNVQDLAPKKDAKGGIARSLNAANTNSFSADAANLNSAGANSFNADTARNLDSASNLDGGTKNLD